MAKPFVWFGGWNEATCSVKKRYKLNWEPGNGGDDQNNGFTWFTIKLPIRPRQTSEGTRASEKLSRFAPLMRAVLDDPQHKAISEKVLSLTTNAEFYLDGEITSFEGLFVV